MTTLTYIKLQVMDLFKKNPNIHIDVLNKRERKHLINAAAVITGVYPNIFIAKLKEDGVYKSYTFQYVDIITHNLIIRELNSEEV